MPKEIPAINVTGRELSPNKPGEFAYVSRYGSDNDDFCGMNFFCPCGCGGAGMLMFVEMDGHPKWDWDGNEDAPTLKPSILRTSGCKWHGFLTGGIFKEC